MSATPTSKLDRPPRRRPELSEFGLTSESYAAVKRYQANRDDWVKLENMFAAGVGVAGLAGGPLGALGAAAWGKIVSRFWTNVFTLRGRLQTPAAIREAVQRYDAAVVEYDAWLSEQARLETRARAEAERMALLKRETFWRGLTGAQFEVEVASLLRALGHRVKVVGGAGDQGIDIIIDERTPVQCKAYDGRPLVPRLVREFLGAMAAFGASSGYLITLDGCTQDARGFAERHGIQVWDITNLIGMVVTSQVESPEPAVPPATRLAPTLSGPTAGASIDVPCPACSRPLQIASGHRGLVRCPICSRASTVNEFGILTPESATPGR